MLRQAWAAALGLALAAPLTCTATPIETVVRTALQSFPAIAVAQANRNVAAFEIERARAQHYPTIDVLGTQRLAGSASNLAQPRLRMNLYASGGIDAQVERETHRAREFAHREHETREDVALAASLAYLRVLRGLRLLRVALANLERHEKLAADFEAIVQFDVGRRYDLIQARSRLELVRLQVADREADVASAREVLARYYPDAHEIRSFALPQPMPEPQAVMDATGIDVHPTIAAARQQLETAEANARVARAARGPRLDVESTAGAQRATQLVLSWPAFDAGARAFEAAAAAEIIGARANVEDRERAIAERQRAALRDWQAAVRRIELSERQIAVADEVVDVYRAQFQIGRRNLLDLLNAFAELAAAQSAHEAARVDRVIARHQIAHALGTLAAFYELPVGGGTRLAEPPAPTGDRP